MQNYKFAFKVSSIFLGTHGSEKEKEICTLFIEPQQIGERKDLPYNSVLPFSHTNNQTTSPQKNVQKTSNPNRHGVPCM